MLNENDFRNRADEALSQLQRALERASDQHDFEVDRKEGALTVEFDEPPAKFVVSPNTPVRQVWVSARVQSFKLDWRDESHAFVLNDGRTLQKLMAEVISDQLGESVKL